MVQPSLHENIWVNMGQRVYLGQLTLFFSRSELSNSATTGILRPSCAPRALVPALLRPASMPRGIPGAWEMHRLCVHQPKPWYDTSSLLQILGPRKKKHLSYIQINMIGKESLIYIRQVLTWYKNHMLFSQICKNCSTGCLQNPELVLKVPEKCLLSTVISRQEFQLIVRYALERGYVPPC